MPALPRLCPDVGMHTRDMDEPQVVEATSNVVRRAQEALSWSGSALIRACSNPRVHKRPYCAAGAGLLFIETSGRQDPVRTWRPAIGRRSRPLSVHCKPQLRTQFSFLPRRGTGP
jgi:hypothetical protein